MGRWRGENNKRHIVCGALSLSAEGYGGRVCAIHGVGWIGVVVVARRWGRIYGRCWADGDLERRVCKNEVRRVEQGSTYLPDCRAYELVTPAEKGATQALVFEDAHAAEAIPAEDGERLALSSETFLGGNPGSDGTNVVFSRGASGWEMTSLQPSRASAK